MGEDVLQLADALLLAVPAAAQKNDKAMRATAPEKMTRPGEGDATRECDQMAMDQHIAMEDRTRFVKDYVAKKMKR